MECDKLLFYCVKYAGVTQDCKKLFERCKYQPVHKRKSLKEPLKSQETSKVSVKGK